MDATASVVCSVFTVSAMLFCEELREDSPLDISEICWFSWAIWDWRLLIASLLALLESDIAVASCWATAPILFERSSNLLDTSLARLVIADESELLTLFTTAARWSILELSEVFSAWIFLSRVDALRLSAAIIWLSYVEAAEVTSP